MVEELRSMKLKEAARKIEDGIEETLTYCEFPSEHWTRIRTNNVIERLNREIRRRTRVVGSFPDATPPSCWSVPGCACGRHQWGNKKYMNMKHLELPLRMPPLPADFIHARACKPICEKYLTLPHLLRTWNFRAWDYLYTENMNIVKKLQKMLIPSHFTGIT